MALVAGVDSSTSGCKVEVRDAESGELVRSGQRPHTTTVPPRSEQDPRCWWDALSSLLDEHGHDVEAISVAGQQHGMVVLDDERRVLRPAKLWNDTESAPQAAALVETWGAERWAKVVGSVPVASFTITKLAWLREHEPEVFVRVAHVLLPHDWLTLQLTGELVTDRGDASGTGYWSPFEDAYALDVFALVGVDPGVAPAVLSPDACAGAYRDAVVAAGTGDNMGAALGLGLEAGDVAISLGTSGTVFAVSPRPTSDASGAVAGFADATGRFLPLVCTLNATKVTDTMARLLGPERREFEQLALECPPGAGGVVLLPYFDGERTPNLPDATGVLSGLRSDTEPAQLAACRVRRRGVRPARRARRVARCRRADRRRPSRRRGWRCALRRVPATDRGSPPATGRGSTVRPSTWHAARASRPRPSLTGREVATVSGEWASSDGRLVEPDASVDAVAVREAYRIGPSAHLSRVRSSIVIRTSFNDDWRFRPKVQRLHGAARRRVDPVGAGAPAPRRDDRRAARPRRPCGAPATSRAVCGSTRRRSSSPRPTARQARHGRVRGRVPRARRCT